MLRYPPRYPIRFTTILAASYSCLNPPTKQTGATNKQDIRIDIFRVIKTEPDIQSNIQLDQSHSDKNLGAITRKDPQGNNYKMAVSGVSKFRQISNFLGSFLDQFLDLQQSESFGIYSIFQYKSIFIHISSNFQLFRLLLGPIFGSGTMEAQKMLFEYIPYAIFRCKSIFIQNYQVPSWTNFWIWYKARRHKRDWWTQAGRSSQAATSR